MTTHTPHRVTTAARRRLLLPTFGAVLGLPVIALAAPIDVPHSFEDGEVIDAERFNENFAALEVAVDDNDARITALEGGGPLSPIPTGAVMFFELDACPAGFSPSAAMRGRVPLGLPTDGEVGAAVGTGLENEALRTITEVPAHSHGVDPPEATTSGVAAHSHTVDPPNTETTNDGSHTHVLDLGNGGASSTHVQGSNLAGDAQIADSSVPVNSGGAHTHDVDISVFNSGSAGAHSHDVDLGAFDSASTGVAAVDVTMPYVQLLACRKD
jgi:hypothetical protein